MGFIKIALKKRDKEPKDVKILSPTDILKEVNNEITEKLKKLEVFDIDVPTRCLGRFGQFRGLIKARNLVCADSGCEIDGVTTMVVATREKLIIQHEKDR